jgi:hypothetical protein
MSYGNQLIQSIRLEQISVSGQYWANPRLDRGLERFQETVKRKLFLAG